MKVIIAPDLHIDISGWQRFEIIKDHKPDYLILAGDTCAYQSWQSNMTKIVQTIPNTKIVFISGNHDFYSTFKINVNNIIPFQKSICDQLGIHYLPSENLIINGITFIGSCLWYDYSFVDQKKYTSKELKSGVSISARWNDMVYITKSGSDKKFCKEILEEFEMRINEIKTDKIICVTHMLPYKELNAHPDGLFSAYSGTTKAGQMLDKLGDKLLASYCGHTHLCAKFNKHLNIGNDYGNQLKIAILDI